jgi:hypothetical protein
VSPGKQQYLVAKLMLNIIYYIYREREKSGRAGLEPIKPGLGPLQEYICFIEYISHSIIHDTNR